MENKIIQNSKSGAGVPPLVMLSLSKHLAVRRMFISPDKFFISSQLYKSFTFETLNAMLPLPFGLSPTSRTYCLLFLATHRSKRGSRRSHRKVSSPCYATTLCAPGSSQQHGAVARTIRLARHLFARRRCGSCSVFEVAHSAYKYAPNRLLFGRNYSQ